jgi:predicted MFS family arabinose efflux permease
MSGLLVGILLSRTVSGLVAQAASWRTVYWTAAALLVAMALVLGKVLPDEPVRQRVTYWSLVVGSFLLLVAERELRRRAWFGGLVFAGFSAMWTTLSFHLSGAPFHYSNAVIGLFGLFGVAGVTAANVAGHHADQQRTQRTTVAAALLFVAAFAGLWFGRHSFWAMALGIMVLDAGMQGMQISNQSIIYSLVADARSRITSAYMVCCFTGASIGSYAAGQLYATYGWGGVCSLGAFIGLGLLVPALWWRSPRPAA